MRPSAQDGYPAAPADVDFRVFCLGCGEPIPGSDHTRGDEGPDRCSCCREGVPVAIGEEPTKRVRTMSDAELLAELEQHAEYGGVR